MTNYVLFGLFVATLLGIARFHKQALPISLGGFAAVALVRFFGTEFDFVGHMTHESGILIKLGGLLLGFSLLANYFERSHLSEKLAEKLPSGTMGPFALLVLIAVMSAVVDNIAAALIGGAIAISVFQRRVHIGYLAAIVAASNAGGAGSVIGDTTTTMMWIEGASPLWVAEAAIGAAVALLFFGTFASRQQNRLQPLVRSTGERHAVDLACVGIVLLIIVSAVVTNLLWDSPTIGVWGAILLGGLLRRPAWAVLPSAATGALFLLALVATASMMPVESLPPADQWTTLALGFVSAFFDNIPLTKLAIQQNAYDWGFLAYAVGYGGSMLWFGSSAGVAISGMFPEAKSAKNWILNGWHVAVGYVLGFFAMVVIVGWHAHPLPKKGGAEQHQQQPHRAAEPR